MEGPDGVAAVLGVGVGVGVVVSVVVRRLAAAAAAAAAAAGGWLRASRTWTWGSSSDGAEESESEDDDSESSVVWLPGRRPQGWPPPGGRTRCTRPERCLGWGLAMVGGEIVWLGAVVVWCLGCQECVWILDMVWCGRILDTLWCAAVRRGLVVWGCRGVCVVGAWYVLPVEFV